MTDRNPGSDFATERTSQGRVCTLPSAPLFAGLAESQSVGLESPRHYIQRNFQKVPAIEAAILTGSLWPLIAELYERPLEAPAATPSVASPVPSIFSEANNWEVLLWAAIECANFVVLHAQRPPRDLAAKESRYQETLPAFDASFHSSKFCERRPPLVFLSERQLAGAADDAEAPALQLDAAADDTRVRP